MYGDNMDKTEKVKRIMVTGAAGFVGSSMSERQLELGHNVHGIDNFITGSQSNIQRLNKHPGFHFDQIDINNQDDLHRVLKEQYDEIYHFACPTGVPNISVYGEEMLRTCSQGTENVLRVAQQHKASLVYASSAEVYGDPEVFPQREDYFGNVDPVGERSTYEEGKRFGETLVKLYAQKYKVNAKFVRIFNSYGPNMSRSDTRIIPNSLAKVIAKKPLTIFGNGEQTRTHLHVSDLLNGLEIVMDKGENATPYNVGSNKRMSINQLVKTLSQIVGRELPVQYKEHFIEDHGGREPDVSAIMRLGWRMNTDLKTGLTAMCREYGIDVKTAPAKTLSSPPVWPSHNIHELPA
ncbi:hypothetical protein AB833_18655 [Chromatiales bacterium (ex Bugula neritina AB1)]|nr:hypothetical protein AB833_18655 [Chromatiales bacterium (ex Bugula neritina AB1)]